MSLDIDIIKARAKNEYRLSKVRGEAMISVRIPGGIMPAHLLAVAQQIAEQYGNGLIHLTTRQKLAMPGIKYQDMNKVNAALEPFIKEIEVETCGIEVEDTTAGYQTIGGRNIVACQGNTICQKGNIDCTGLAQRMEKHLYPNPYHLKMVIAGCPNDCAKANMADFGILGIAKIHFNSERCIGCGACVKACSHHAVDCLAIKHGKAVKEESKCIGCGECVLACPTLAWQRDPKQLYMVKLGGAHQQEDSPYRQAVSQLGHRRGAACGDQEPVRVRGRDAGWQTHLPAHGSPYRPGWLSHVQGAGAARRHPQPGSHGR